MRWLLGLVRGAAGDAHAALAEVPESVVRDGAGWLTFVVRWGHADLLGGCDIAGLVQVRVRLAPYEAHPDSRRFWFGSKVGNVLNKPNTKPTVPDVPVNLLRGDCLKRSAVVYACAGGEGGSGGVIAKLDSTFE